MTGDGTRGDGAQADGAQADGAQAGRDRLIDAALNHVVFDGMSDRAVAQGARDIGMAPALVRLHLPRGKVAHVGNRRCHRGVAIAVQKRHQPFRPDQQGTGLRPDRRQPPFAEAGQGGQAKVEPVIAVALAPAHQLDEQIIHRAIWRAVDMAHQIDR